jgi:hypothetical protein
LCSLRGENVLRISNVSKPEIFNRMFVKRDGVLIQINNPKGPQKIHSDTSPRLSTYIIIMRLVEQMSQQALG